MCDAGRVCEEEAFIFAHVTPGLCSLLQMTDAHLSVQLLHRLKPQVRYSGFQLTGMIEGFWGV